MRDRKERENRTEKEIQSMQRKIEYLQLLGRLTSGLHENVDDDGGAGAGDNAIVVRIHTHFKRLLR